MINLNRFEHNIINVVFDKKKSMLNDSDIKDILKYCREEKERLLAASPIDYDRFNSISSLEDKLRD